MILEKHQIAIVLTGTINPNTNLVNNHLDPEIRRKEYLKTIHFYRQFGKVYFLENSTYPLDRDAGFQNIPNVSIRKFPVSTFSDRGKGFQEFEMLDAWVESESNLPARWIKVTGRYIYEDFQKILTECYNSDRSIIINQYLFAKWADVALFYTTTDFYKDRIVGIYQQCDDKNNSFIERVMNINLSKVSKTSFSRFKTYLKCTGIAGSTGKAIGNTWQHAINSSIVRLNYLLDKRYIWISF
jgi:hypothetical protein